MIKHETLIRSTAITANGWVYEQVCLAECSNLPINLMANLLIYRVISSCGLFSRNLNTENKKTFIKMSEGKRKLLFGDCLELNKNFKRKKKVGKFKIEYLYIK